MFLVLMFGLSIFSSAWSPAAEPEAVRPIKVLVAYHSLSGNTEKMAQAVVEGAKGLPGTQVMLKRVGQVTAE
jgi:NAD(P)H dehydrogenase (quinone)